MANLKTHEFKLEKNKFGASIPFIEKQHNIKILLAYVRGSHMYGTATDKSDVDITFVYQQPTVEILKSLSEQVAKPNYIPYIDVSGTGDIVGYEIQNYIELLVKNNPTILETLDIPEECVIFKDDSMKVFESQEKWVTKLTENSILGYAKSQIKKATGLNKNMNNRQPEERNSILHYCYIVDGAKSIPFLDWYDTYISYHGSLEEQYLNHNNWGLVKVENGKGLYALYLNELDGDNFAGLIKDSKSTQLRLSSIPKTNIELRKEVYTLYYNLDGFEVHCKQHKAYWEWVKNRNEARFDLNQKAGQGVDLKNMSHLFRLLEMALNVSLGKGIIVRTENVQFLRDIKEGKYPYEELMKDAEKLVSEIHGNYETVNLPEMIDVEYAKNILLTFRRGF
jgi:uncharacterized protein